MHRGHRYVCVPCRIVSGVAPSCGHEAALVGHRWRAPRKGDDRAWRRIAAGDWLWDETSLRRAARRFAFVMRTRDDHTDGQ